MIVQTLIIRQFDRRQQTNEQLEAEMSGINDSQKTAYYLIYIN